MPEGSEDAWNEFDDEEAPPSWWEIPAGAVLGRYGYEIPDGSGSPAADDSGEGCLFIWGDALWMAASDPGEVELFEVQDLEDGVRKFVAWNTPRGANAWIAWGEAADEGLRRRIEADMPMGGRR